MRLPSWTLPLLFSPLLGCNGSNPGFFLSANKLLSMTALDDRVAFVDTNSHTAFLLDPADKTATPRIVSVGTTPVAAVKRNGNNQLLVLSRGDRGSATDSAIPAELDVIAADPSVAAARYTLTGRFSGLSQSSDGRFVMLYHTSSEQSLAGGALFNPNELALLDFTPDATPTVPTVTSKSIRSLGGTPTDIVFSPTMNLATGARRLAVILSQGYVTLLDLDHFDRTEISIPLCAQSTGCTITPSQVLFDATYAHIYLRSTSATDIFQITLSQATATGSENDFWASMSMLAVGASPSDMMLYQEAADSTSSDPSATMRLAVAAPSSKSLLIISPSTSDTVTITTTIPVTQIVPFTVPNTATPTQPKNRALLVDTVYGNTAVSFADLELVETAGGLSLSDYPIGAAVTSVYPLVSQGIAVLVAGKSASTSALTVVDLANRSFSAIGSGSVLSTPVLETQSPSRVWSVDSSTGLCYLDLVGVNRLTSNEIWLDQSISSIVPLSVASADGTRYLVITHPDPDAMGNLTFLNATSPDRATARTVRGFLLSNYIERAAP